MPAFALSASQLFQAVVCDKKRPAPAVFTEYFICVRRSLLEAVHCAQKLDSARPIAAGKTQCMYAKVHKTKVVEINFSEGSCEHFL